MNECIRGVLAAFVAATAASTALGGGFAGFAPPQTLGVGSTPHSVAIADLDGNGDPDLVAANEDSSTVSVLLNNGDGTFAPQQVFGAGISSYSVAIGDLDGDAALAVTNATVLGTDSVLRNNGDGTFASPQTFSVGGMHPTSVGGWHRFPRATDRRPRQSVRFAGPSPSNTDHRSGVWPSCCFGP